jgi:hypothetical protein
MGSSNEEKEKKIPTEKPEAEKELIDVILQWIAAVVGIFSLLLIAWLYRPWIYDKVTPDPTFTPTVPTSTPMNTPTPAPTWTPAPTMTFTPSPVPMATSVYSFPELSRLNPAAPGYINEPVIIDENDAIVSPDLSNLQWASSSLYGYTSSDEYHLTFSPGTVSWQMDKSLAAGYYEVFVMDTLYSSGGILTFEVKSGDTVLTPLTGSQKVMFRISQGRVAQTSDAWHSIGVYLIPENNLLSVSTQWQNRDENTVVAIDRVLISHLPDDTGEILQTLPKGLGTYILDDEGAKVEVNTYPVLSENRSWGDQSTILINPDYNTKVTWEYPDLLPIGTYEVVVYIPELNGESEVKYQLYADDFLLNHTNGQTAITVKQFNYQGNWLSLGEWAIPLTLSYPVELKLEMGVNEGSLGEVGVDAVGFILKSMPDAINQDLYFLY